MNSIAAMIRKNAEFQAMLDRSTFDAAGTLAIRNFGDLDRASWWCEERWEEAHRRYRRTVDAAGEKATFEFEHLSDVTAFRLMFG